MINISNIKDIEKVEMCSVVFIYLFFFMSNTSLIDELP